MQSLQDTEMLLKNVENNGFPVQVNRNVYGSNYFHMCKNQFYVKFFVFICYVFYLFSLLEGGCASGFRNVPAEDYEARLLHFCRDKTGHVVVKQVQSEHLAS